MGSEKEHDPLSNIPKKDIFKTPDGYFDALPENISRRIAESNKPAGKSIVFRVERWKYITLAAAAVITLLIIFLPSRQVDRHSPSAAELIAQITDEECLAFLKNSDVEIDDLLGLSEPGLWNEVIGDAVPDAEEEWNEKDEEMIYERFGVSPDENLQIL
jgi:hypothetical protein